MLEKLLLHFTPQMCSYDNNIESIDLLKYSELISCLLVLEQNNKFFLWEIISLIQLDMNRFLKWMQYRLKLMDVDENEDVVMVLEGILNTMVLVVIIPQILKKRKPRCITRSGEILRQNKKMWSVYKINLPRTMRIIVIDVVHPNIWSNFTKHQ